MKQRNALVILFFCILLSITLLCAATTTPDSTTAAAAPTTPADGIVNNNDSEAPPVDVASPPPPTTVEFVVEESKPTTTTTTTTTTPTSNKSSSSSHATTNTIMIDAEWQTSKFTNVTKVQVNKLEHKKYKFRPKVIGESKSITLMNAKDDAYYYRKLKDPIAVLWLLTVGGRGKRPIHLNYTMKRLYEKGHKMNIQVEFKETHLFDLVASQDGFEQLVYQGKSVSRMPDAVLSRLGAKIDYYGLAVVRHLEKMGVLVLNNHNALEVSRDKLHTVQDLAAHGMPIPKTMIAKFPPNEEIIKREFKFPLILKHSSGTQGKGVMLIETADHLKGISDMIDVSKPMIFQEFIANSAGKDIRAIVVGGKVVGAMMRVAKSGFKANFHQGGYVKKIKLSPAVEWLAIEATRLIGLDVAGVDILIDKNSYKICEINSSPGFNGFEMATEVDVPFHILDFVKLRTGVWQKRNREKKRVVIPVEEEVQEPAPAPTPTLATIEINVDASQTQQPTSN